jgi:hypothetical protein
VETPNGRSPGCKVAGQIIQDYLAHRHQGDGCPIEVSVPAHKPIKPVYVHGVSLNTMAAATWKASKRNAHLTDPWAMSVPMLTSQKAGKTAGPGPIIPIQQSPSVAWARMGEGDRHADAWIQSPTYILLENKICRNNK